MKHIHVVEILSCISLSLLGFMTYSVYQLVPQITSTLDNINEFIPVIDDLEYIIDAFEQFEDAFEQFEDVLPYIQNTTDTVQELKDLYYYKNVEFYCNGSTPEYR